MEAKAEIKSSSHKLFTGIQLTRKLPHYSQCLRKELSLPRWHPHPIGRAKPILSYYILCRVHSPTQLLHVTRRFVWNEQFLSYKPNPPNCIIIWDSLLIPCTHVVTNIREPLASIATMACSNLPTITSMSLVHTDIKGSLAHSKQQGSHLHRGLPAFHRHYK